MRTVQPTAGFITAQNRRLEAIKSEYAQVRAERDTAGVARDFLAVKKCNKQLAALANERVACLQAIALFQATKIGPQNEVFESRRVPPLPIETAAAASARPTRP